MTEVTVSITLSKTFTIETEDYESLQWAVENQVILPNNAHHYIQDKPVTKQALRDLKDWHVDDFVVIKEN
jgi:hypothetical protein